MVGSGNAGLCAAISAAEGGANVLVLEAGAENDFGGNSRYTAGAMRFTYESPEELMLILENCEDPQINDCIFGSYPRSKFISDLVYFNHGSSLGSLQAQLVEKSYETMSWLVSHGLEFIPIFERQAYRKHGKFHFWGGLTLAAKGEGEGLVMSEKSIASSLGVKFRLRSRVESLETESGRLVGVCLDSNEKILGSAVVLACGGFESSSELRAKHLGEEWREVIVRGTSWNRGDGIKMAEKLGAAAAGSYAECHSVCMDGATPEFSGNEMPHSERRHFRKISYPFGVMINSDGRRFVDEGADFRNYTYAQYGREVLRQPGAFAWQIFDSQVRHLLYDDYRQPNSTRRHACSLEELVSKLVDVDQENTLETLVQYNAATVGSSSFDPTRKDGLGTQGLAIPKSNWALPIIAPPFEAFRVTCGITFTYGGLAIDPEGGVLRPDGTRIPGLFAAGELVGALFQFGYPGGSGLTAGAVFGRMAGASAASFCRG